MKDKWNTCAKVSGMSRITRLWWTCLCESEEFDSVLEKSRPIVWVTHILVPHWLSWLEAILLYASIVEMITKITNITEHILNFRHLVLKFVGFFFGIYLFSYILYILNHVSHMTKHIVKWNHKHWILPDNIEFGKEVLKCRFIFIRIQIAFFLIHSKY